MNIDSLQGPSDTTPHLHVRVERAGDEAAIRAVLLGAFPKPEEADLVDRLRERDAIFSSWIAEIENEMVGYIAFSPVRLQPAHAETPVVVLAPVAIRPGYQQRGFGFLLTKAALRHLRGLGVAAVVVLGHPAYYTRFGFQPASRFDLQSPFPESGDAFMALELAPGALSECAGTRVSFHQAFDELLER